MSYTLNYGPGGNKTISVPDGQSGTVANLTFPGRNFSGYGSPVDQNFLSMVENFASANTQGPASAITGQLWYDVNSSNVTLKYDGLKINTSNTNVANWTNFVTFEPSSNTANTNPKNISGVGTLSASNVVAELANITVANITTLHANTANVKALELNGGNITGANVINATAGNITNMSVTGNLISTNLTMAAGSTNWFTANSSGITITVPVKIEGKLTFNEAISDTPTPITSESQLITVGKAASSTSSVTTGKTFGLDFVYYTGTNATTDRKDAFMGWVGPSWANVSPVSQGEFVFAKSVNSANISDSGNPTLADIVLGNLRASTLIGNVVGDLSNANSKVTIPSASGAINLVPNNIVALTVITNGSNTTGSIVTITGSANNASSNAALIVNGGAYINGNLTAGNITATKIYGTVVAPTGSTTTMANLSVTDTANINNIVANSITSQNITVPGTVSTAQLAANGTATIQTLVVNSSITTSTLTATGSAGVTALKVTSTNLTATGGLDTSAGTITGAWTLSGNSTLEATYSADLAERHHADTTYPTGSVMTVGGTNEITGASTESKVLGVVSDAWAYLMNGGAGPQETHPAVAYVGRVPVRVVGPINKHDEVSPFANGVATASKSNSFGWALESNTDAGEKLVLCIVK